MAEERQSRIGGATWEEYHNVFHGNRVSDHRLLRLNGAPEIRKGLLRARANLGGNASLSGIAEEIGGGVTARNLSDAARGVAGLRPGEDGLSTTEKVLFGLREINES